MPQPAPLSGPLASPNTETIENPFASPQKATAPRQGANAPSSPTKKSGAISVPAPSSAAQGNGLEDIIVTDSKFSTSSSSDADYVMVAPTKPSVPTIVAPGRSRSHTFSSESEKEERLADEPSLYDRHARNGSSGGAGGGRLPPFAANRVKTLPLPPVGQVMPDFDDIVAGRTRNGSLTPGTDEEGGGGGVKRKTSIVKRLKDRIVK